MSTPLERLGLNYLCSHREQIASFLEHSTGSIDIELYDHQALNIIFYPTIPSSFTSLFPTGTGAIQAGTSE